jgi:N6-adenosine-specific RNA methylase IME4
MKKAEQMMVWEREFDMSEELEQFDYADDLQANGKDDHLEFESNAGYIYLPAHVATSLFPKMSHDEFKALKEDIAEHGLRQPILVWRNQVVDGLQRLRACKELGIAPQYASVQNSEETITEFIVSMNLKRRHLDESQRAMIASSLAKLGKGKKLNTAHAVTQAQASAMLNVSIDSIQRARSVETNGIPLLVQAVQAGSLDVTNASAISTLDAETQNRFMQMSDRDILAKAKQIRKDAMQERRSLRIASIEKKRANNRPLTAANDGVYNVVYADPAWDYISQETLGYPTMSLEEIKAMPVNKIASEDAVLFMWCSASLIADALKVIETWGFNYKTHAIWNKQRNGQGVYFRIQHELLLVATRGVVPEVPYHAREASVFTDMVGAPSEKPKRMREVIDNMYPELKKIELFCRGEPANGWDGWGNECAVSPNELISKITLPMEITVVGGCAANDDQIEQSKELCKEAA